MVGLLKLVRNDGRSFLENFVMNIVLENLFL